MYLMMARDQHPADAEAADDMQAAFDVLAKECHCHNLLTIEKHALLISFQYSGISLTH